MANQWQINGKFTEGKNLLFEEVIKQMYVG